MESVLRGLAIYAIVWLVFRVTGKRALSESTTFDFVLLLIISETTQQALLGDDFSVTNAAVVIATLIGTDIVLSLVKQRSLLVEKLLDDVPVLLIEDGTPHRDRMKRTRIDEQDILEAARESRGLERLDQIKHAVLERTGTVSIIPWSDAKA